MGLELSEIAVWGYGLAAVAYLVFSLYLFRAWRGGLPGGVLLVAIVSSSLWAFASTFLSLNPTDALFRVAGLLDVLRNASWFAFLIVLLRPLISGRVRWLTVWSAVMVAILALSVLLDSLGISVGPSPARMVLGAFLGAAVFGLVLVEQLYRDVPSESRWGLKPLCLGLAAGYIFELYLFADGLLFGRTDPDVWAVRGLVHTMLIPLIALSAARSPSWTVRIAVSREMAFHSTALALSGLYLLVIAGAGYYVRYFGGGWGRALQLALLFGGLLLLGVFVFSGSQRARLRVFINKHLFPYRYDYRNEWLRFTQALSSAGDSMDLGQSVIKALSDLVESSGGTLWLKDGQGRFTMHARLNHPGSDAAEEEGSDLCRFIDEHEWVINLEELRSRPADHKEVAIPAWLSAMADAWLVVPLKSGGVLVGFVVLNTARTRFDINWEVLDLLKTAQRQAASYLARMQAAEALLESRKFDSFNRMSAFVVHDLKNLVAQLSLMLKNAERHKDNPEFQEDMIQTVTHVEARMRSLMIQLQEKKSIEPPRRLDVLAVANRIVTAKRHQSPQPRLACDPSGACEVYAHPERLERVLGHLVQNALDATPDDGKVSLRIRIADDALVEVVVEDTGCGMSDEFMRSRLFKPFESSKTSGMGIGVFEAQQYISELGGSIRIESEEGCGTRVVVLLPWVARGGAEPVEDARNPSYHND